jgi:hypothetical protein
VSCPFPWFPPDFPAFRVPPKVAERTCAHGMLVTLTIKAVRKGRNAMKVGMGLAVVRVVVVPHSVSVAVAAAAAPAAGGGVTISTIFIKPKSVRIDGVVRHQTSTGTHNSVQLETARSVLNYFGPGAVQVGFPTAVTTSMAFPYWTPAAFLGRAVRVGTRRLPLALSHCEFLQRQAVLRTKKMKDTSSETECD